MEKIKLFMEKVKTDKTLQSALKELTRRKAGLDEVIALAAGHGFAFTKTEWETAMKEAAPAGELSEEQLAAVSGGSGSDVIQIFSVIICNVDLDGGSIDGIE